MASFLSRSIYEDRHDRIRADLDERGLEALFVMIPDNVTYVSGFFLDVATFERPVAAIIPKQGEPCLGDAIMHRAGHGIGLSGHEYPIDTAFNHRPLRAGMVMSTEPGIYIKGLGGFRHSDVTIVGRDRPELITTYPRDMESLTLS